MSDVSVGEHNAAIQPQPVATAADHLAAVDELTTALNRRGAQLRCLIRATWPVLQSLEALVYNADDDDAFMKEAARECAQLRDVLAVAEPQR